MEILWKDISYHIRCIGNTPTRTAYMLHSLHLVTWVAALPPERGLEAWDSLPVRSVPP
jgi:hypothetical protein